MNFASSFGGVVPNHSLQQMDAAVTGCAGGDLRAVSTAESQC